MALPYTNHAIESITHVAQAFARENYNDTYGAPHLLRALVHPEAGLVSFLEELDKDVAYLRDWAEVRIEEYAKAARLPASPLADPHIEAVLNEADLVRLRFGFDEVSPVCLLAAILKPHTGFTAAQLKSLPLRESEIYSHYRVESVREAGSRPTLENGTSATSKSDGVLQQYCTDKTARAKAHRLDPIIGREAETRQMIEILGRRSKPNVIIAGEPGVGKTALVEGFAQAIIAGKVPVHLKEATLLELDLGSLMAGASYKGEVEDRLKKIIAALKSLDRAILFIDELHVLLDSKGPMGSGAGNLLKPELARGELTVIGATTLEEYRKIIEPEQAFNRRFELLQISEPDSDAATKMVALLAPHYTAHHGIEVDRDALPECVRLAKRYIKDKRLPDSALDLLDRTMSAIRMMDETSSGELEAAKEEFELIAAAEEIEADKIAELRWYFRLLEARLSPVLFGALTDETEIDKLDTSDALIDHGRKTLAELKSLAEHTPDKVGKAEVAAVVAAKTGIPIGKIQAGEKEKLLGMESFLKRRMVGQGQALKAISEAIVESRSGINKAGQPIGSFFLLGPTGTGKTELAKSIAELLFNDEKAMIRLDMSEFKEEHSAALLYGAPPGYVGYEEGGMLVNKIRQQPYSVVLFDEIEKAHPSVFDIFLQIMDEGHIHDKLGKEGDFSNSLVLFTSNIGSDFIVEKFNAGEVPASNQLMERMGSHFRPEFLARLTEIIPFGPITEEMAVEIFDIQMRSLHEALKKQGITLKVSEEAKRMLALMDFTAKYGARQIGGVIRQQIRRPISRMIVSGAVEKGSSISLSLDETTTLYWQCDKVKHTANVD